MWNDFLDKETVVGKPKTGLERFMDEPDQTVKPVPAKPVSPINISAYDPEALFGKIAPKAPEASKAEVDPSLIRRSLKKKEVNIEDAWKGAPSMSMLVTSTIKGGIKTTTYPRGSNVPEGYEEFYEEIPTFRQGEEESFVSKMMDKIGGFFVSKTEERARATYALVLADELGVAPSDVDPDLVEAFRTGFGESTTGLIRQVESGREYPKMPSKVVPTLTTPQRLAMGAGGMVGDLPYMGLGAVAGAGGGPITAMAGAFALPQGLRAYYSYKLDKGDIETPEQFIEVLKSSVLATLKGEVIGAVTGAVGKVAAPLGGLGRTGVEAVTLTGVGAGLEGRLPTSQDFFDSVMLLVGLKGVMRAPAVAARIKDLWVKSGRAPKDIIEDIKTDPKLVTVLTGEGEIPPDVIEKAKAKVEETEKKQAELAVRLAAAKKKTVPEEIVKEELKIKGEKVKAAKVKTEPDYQAEADRVGVTFNGIQEGAKGKTLPLFTDPQTKSTFSIGKGQTIEQALQKVRDKFAAAKKVKGKETKEEPKPKAVLRKKAKVTEPITELDEQTGTPRPEGLAPDVHPFRDKDPKHTATMKKLYQEKINNVSATPEVFTRYLINEVNRWLNGEDVPIDKVRAGLSELSARADNLTAKFDTANDFAAWKDTVSEAAKWARGADRLKTKRTGGTQLNMMIPVNEIPERVRDILKKIKVIGEGYTNISRISTLHRNRKIFDATGFWLGKDGKWRYEISDYETKYHIPEEARKFYFDNGIVTLPLTTVFSNDKLFQAIPELKDSVIEFRKDLKNEKGYYDEKRKAFVIRSLGDKETTIHELQHAINDIMRSRFRGSDPEIEVAKIDRDIFARLEAAAKTPEVQFLVRKAMYEYDYDYRGSKRNTLEVNMHDMLEASRDPQESNAIAGALRDYINSSAFENYMKDPGEMESRLTSARMEMTAEERKKIPPWETLENMLVNEGAAEAGYSPKTGSTLYMGIDPTQIPEAARKLFPALSKLRSKLFDKEIPKIDLAKLSPDEKAIYEEGKKWNDTFEEARKAKDFDLGRFIDRAGIHTYRAVHERKGMLRNELRKKYGEAGDKLVQFIDAADAMDGRADRMYYEMFKEAYANIPSNLSSHVDAVDLMNRLKDIYAYKTGKEFKPPKNMSPTQTAAFDGLLELYRRLTPEERARAEKASRIMSDHVKIWVDDMVRVGLKSAEEGEKLKSHDYRKIRSFVVENMYDQKYKLRLGDKLIKQTDSGVDPLGKNAISMMETDSRILYKETANRIYRRVSNQEVKLALKEFDAKFLDNPFVIFKENDVAAGRPIRKAPKDWVTDFWYDEGKLKTYKMHPDVALQLLSSGPHMSFPLTRILTNFLGVNLTRSLTVGTSALWATTRGITMDMGHSFFSARYFNEKGEPIRLFSKFAPKFIGQIGRDMGNTFHDVITRGPKTGIYEKNGGTMPFLAMREQHFLGRGTKAPGVYDKFMDGLSFWGQSMERWNRVAVMERLLRQKADERGITLDEAYKDKDLVRQATNTAVERLPYRQGGWLVKEIDKIFGPFISASYNATRTFARGAVENPVDFWVRVSNIAIPTVGATIAMALWAPEAKRDTPEWQHIGGAVFTLFPDTLNFIDENGDKRWINIRLPLDPNISMLYNTFRGLTNKMLYDTGMTDVEPDYSAVVDSLVRSLPADTPISPTLSAWFSYFRNLDVWKESKVVPEAFGWPESGMEGQFDPNLGQLPKDIGKATGLSGPRLVAAARNLGFQSNEFAWAMGKLYDKVNSDIDPRLREQHWAITISQIPGLKNLMSITVPRSYRVGDRTSMSEDEIFKSYLRRSELDAKAEGYYWKGVGKESEIEKFIDSFEEPSIRKSLEDKKKFIMNIKDLPHRDSWSRVFHTTPEYKAEDFYKIWKAESSPSERVALEKELDILLEAGFVGKESQRRFFDTFDEFKIGEK